ncbi:MAG: DUF4974 domain-containing protein [Dysgonamonadaceae bacterium]
MDKDKCLNIFQKYVSGVASPLEIAELKSFLKDDIHLNKWLEDQIVSSSGDMDMDLKMKVLYNIRTQTKNYSTLDLSNSDGRDFRFYLRRIVNVAAILLPVVLILGAYLYLKPHNIELFEVVADMGEKASLTLPEGSKISVNSGSKLIYYSDYNQKERLVRLDGEAFFDVRHNPEKPFIVQCKEIKIKVLGTRFGIKAYPDEENISIVLNSGKIQLITPKDNIEMKPNDRILYNRITQQVLQQKVNAEDYTDWRQNRLRFDGEPVEFIMKTISRMHNIDIVFDNEDLKKQRFTGTVDNTNIESVLNAIKLTSSINYRIEDSTVHLYK